MRHLDEILQAQDWSGWEQQYNGGHGQPPIPPWGMAGVILYGLMRGIRSSRQLEYACLHKLDFMWLAEGRSIDHDTICKFRTKFQKPLKELFRQIGRVAMAMGLIQLVEVAFDGTRVKANAGRFRTWTAAKAEQALEELAAQVERMLSEAAAADAAEGTRWDEGSSRKLPPELDDAMKRQQQLRQTLEKLREADASRKKVRALLGHGAATGMSRESVRRLSTGRGVPGREGQRRADDPSGRARTVAGKDLCEDANGTR